MSPYIFNTGQRITIETQQDEVTHERFSRISFFVNSSVENVYRICLKLPSFPIFLSNLAGSDAGNPYRSHRRVIALGKGDSFSFDVAITRTVTDELICWETLANRCFESEGCIRLSREAQGTRLRMDFSCKVYEGETHETLKNLLLLPRTRLLKNSIRKLIEIIESEEEPQREFSWI
jgi:uncharacterized membrane protein